LAKQQLAWLENTVTVGRLAPQVVGWKFLAQNTPGQRKTAEGLVYYKVAAEEPSKVLSNTANKRAEQQLRCAVTIN
jgi:hypothetical protein